MKTRLSRAIAVIGGTGPAGTGLALRWLRAGETVIIGSRDAGRAQQAAETIRKRAGANAQVSGMENSAACAASDLVVLTVPFEGQAALLKQLRPAIRPGSVLIDATVPLAASVADAPVAPLACGKARPRNRRQSWFRRAFPSWRHSRTFRRTCSTAMKMWIAT